MGVLSDDFYRQKVKEGMTLKQAQDKYQNTYGAPSEKIQKQYGFVIPKDMDFQPGDDAFSQITPTEETFQAEPPKETPVADLIEPNILPGGATKKERAAYKAAANRNEREAKNSPEKVISRAKDQLKKIGTKKDTLESFVTTMDTALKSYQQEVAGIKKARMWTNIARGLALIAVGTAGRAHGITPQNIDFKLPNFNSQLEQASRDLQAIQGTEMAKRREGRAERSEQREINRMNQTKKTNERLRKSAAGKFTKEHQAELRRLSDRFKSVMDRRTDGELTDEQANAEIKQLVQTSKVIPFKRGALERIYDAEGFWWWSDDRALQTDAFTAELEKASLASVLQHAGAVPMWSPADPKTGKRTRGLVPSADIKKYEKAGYERIEDE